LDHYITTMADVLVVLAAINAGLVNPDIASAIKRSVERISARAALSNSNDLALSGSKIPAVECANSEDVNSTLRTAMVAGGGVAFATGGAGLGIFAATVGFGATICPPLAVAATGLSFLFGGGAAALGSSFFLPRK
jgi:hypothetical protein